MPMYIYFRSIEILIILNYTDNKNMLGIRLLFLFLIYLIIVF